MRRAALCLAAAGVLAACTDHAGAQRAVEAYGFTEVSTTGWEPFGCGRDDDFHTGFVATNSRGQRIQGVVCSGAGPFGKAATVRVTGVMPPLNAAPVAP